MKKVWFILTVFGLLSAVILVLRQDAITNDKKYTEQAIPTNTPSPSPTPQPIPDSVILENDYHIYQTFNNCGPAALSMALSYYGITVSQEELGIALRPYQNQSGDNDDKSVTLDELADQALKYNLKPFHRPSGTLHNIKQFIANGTPVIARTGLYADDDIGHYRVIKGYDDRAGVLIQDDSLQGHNLTYSYEEFVRLWKRFNYEYLVIVPPDKEQTAEGILGLHKDELYSWKTAVDAARFALAENPDDILARFNLSVGLYHLKDLRGAIREFEAVEEKIPFRTLWYQIEPIRAYLEDGNHQRVLSLSDAILQNGNRAFSELYIMRGKVYRNQGDIGQARVEFEKAVYYNVNSLSAREALNSL